jgi:DNA segregation ATPase FtsK/SpoIIIE-like protein
MLGQVAQMVAWGWCRPVLVDVVRHGVDLAVYEPLAGPVAVTIKEARQAIRDAAEECASRLPAMRETGVRCLTRFTPDRPLIALVVDEVHAVMADKVAGAALTRFAQETRAMGGLVIAATQYPTAEAIDSTFRMQLAHKMVYKVANADESRTILGVSAPDGQGPHELRAGPGACVADLDGSGLVTMRSWWLPDQWLSDHVAACSSMLG